MAQPRFNEIVKVIRESVPVIPKRIIGRGMRVTWPVPPLMPDPIRIGDSIFYEDLKPQVHTDSGTLLEIYEDFVGAQDHVSLEDLRSTLVKRLKLSKPMASWLFPSDFPKGEISHDDQILIWTCSLLLLIYDSNPKNALSAQEGSEFCVQLNGVWIGFRDGALMSHLTRPIPYDYEGWKPLMDSLPSLVREVSVDNALATFWRATLDIKDEQLRSDVRMLLRVLFYRYSHLGRLRDYLYNGMRELQPAKGEGLVKLVDELLNNIVEIPNPYPYIVRRLREHGVDNMVIDKLFDPNYIIEPGGIAPPDAILAWTKGLRNLIKVNQEFKKCRK